MPVHFSVTFADLAGKRLHMANDIWMDDRVTLTVVDILALLLPDETYVHHRWLVFRGVKKRVWYEPIWFMVRIHLLPIVNPSTCGSVPKLAFCS